MFRPNIIHISASARSTLRRQLTTAALPRSAKKSTNPIRLGLLGAGTASVLGALQYFKEVHDIVPDLSPLPTLLADAPSPYGDTPLYKDPTSGTPFPSKLVTPEATMILVGTGVRVVSFLSVKVYCAAFYVDEVIMKDLSSVEGWQGYTADKLLPPFPKPDGALAGEELMQKILDLPHNFAVIITPLRSTTLPHLRDGFARALVARLKLPHVAKQFTDEESENSAQSIVELKSFFPNSPLAKGAPLYALLSGTDRSVRFAVTDPECIEMTKDLGTLHNSKLARQLFLSYFGDLGAISEELRKSCARGFAGEAR